MKKTLIKVSAGVIIGVLMLLGAVWLLGEILGDHVTRYAGEPLSYWQQQLNGRDVGASNQAYAVVSTQVVPQLIDTMFHDTNDFKFRSTMVNALNTLPGIQIYFSDADARRVFAVEQLGELGSAAAAAVPFLIQAVNGKDDSVRSPAIKALGKIQRDPAKVIPVLINDLKNAAVNVEAATALGNFGSRAKSAIPQILPLLHSEDEDVRAAAAKALIKIDPAAPASATNAAAK